MQQSQISSLSAFTLSFICYENWKNDFADADELMDVRPPVGNKTLGSHWYRPASQSDLFLDPLKSSALPFKNIYFN